MIKIAQKTYQLSKQPKSSDVVTLFSCPDKFIKAFTPDLPKFIRLQKIAVEPTSVNAAFTSLVPIELDAKIDSTVGSRSGEVECQINFNFRGGSRAKDRIFLNIRTLRMTLVFSARKNQLSVVLQYTKGEKPSPALLHYKALAVLTRQARPLAQAVNHHLP